MSNAEVPGNLPRAMFVETIPHEHVANREGRFFQSTHLFTGIGAGASVQMLVVTGDAVNYAMMVNVTALTETFAEPHAGTTVSDVGTAPNIPPVSTNGKDGQTPETDIYVAPTVTDNGQALPTGLVPASEGGGPGGGSGGSVNMGGYVLPENTNHLLIITNQGAESTDIHAKFSWLEEK